MLSNLFWCAVRYWFDARFCVRYFLCFNGKELFQWFDGKLQIWNGTADAIHWKCVPVIVSFKRFSFCRWKMEGSKLLASYLLSLLLCTDASFGAKHFNRDDKRRERHAYFVRNPSKRLNSSILDSFMVSEPMRCFFRCISHQECYSVNFASVSHDGRHMCELLNADKFQNSSSFLHSISFDHYNKKVSANVSRFTNLIVASVLCVYVLHAWKHSYILI